MYSKAQQHLFCCSFHVYINMFYCVIVKNNVAVGDKFVEVDDENNDVSVLHATINIIVMIRLQSDYLPNKISGANGPHTKHDKVVVSTWNYL